MAASTLAPSNPSLHHTVTLDDSPATRPREASFSSYLSTAEESFSLRLSCEFTDGDAASVQTSLWSGGKKKSFEAQDCELDVFGADKYFSVGMDGDEVAVVEAEKPRKLSPAVEATFACRKPRPGTPSTASEANCRSWSALLRDAQKGPASPTSQKPAVRSARSRGLFRVFRCSCSSEASVEVSKVSKGAGGPNAASRRGAPGQVRPELWCSEESKREDCFSFRPALYPLVAGNLVAAGKELGEKKKVQLPSTAAHGSPFMEEELGSGLRRSLAMMTTSFTVGAGVTRDDDDVCSDSSSDLFEIDSISTGTLQFSTAGGGTSASTTCSAPSEASIEWSVVTARATNFSAVSDGELSPPEAGKPTGIWHQQSAGWSLMGYDGVGKAAGILSNTHELPDMMQQASERLRRRRPFAAMPVITYQPECSRPVDFKQGKGAGAYPAVYSPT